MKKRVGLLILLTLLLAGVCTYLMYGQVILEFLFPIRNDWVDKDGVIYYHNDDGDAVTGWFRFNGDTYYMDPATGGARYSGWLELDGQRFYLDENGHMRTGWQEIDGRLCYFAPDGALAAGRVELEDGTHFLDENGTPRSGWYQEDAREYYLAELGAPVTGWLELEGKRYYCDETGVRVTGMTRIDGQLCYIHPDGSTDAGWLELEGQRVYVTESGLLATGWLTLAEGTYYLDENGLPCSGWLDLEDSRYYLGEDGLVHTGWLELDGVAYYFQADGAMATGRVEVDGQARYFSDSGAYILLVNRWNPVPEDYQVELVSFEGWQVDAACYDDLVKMLADCPYGYTITSAYRSKDAQQGIWNSRLAAYQEAGYSAAGAKAMVAAYVALPGTSEHQLGLAVDISGPDAQKWLAEHCWEYGFILRYPEGKSDITGIAHERWHFRYVGLELAMELKDSGLCLEEYLDQTVNDGSTASDPERLTDAAA